MQCFLPYAVTLYQQSTSLAQLVALCVKSCCLQNGGCLVLLSFAALATVFTAADASALLLKRITDVPTCSPLWISNTVQSELPSSADRPMLLLVAVSVLLHATYAWVFRLHHAVFGVWDGSDRGDGKFGSIRMHQLLLIGLQLSCLAVGVLVGLASCAV
jgi:hypothetical protein